MCPFAGRKSLKALWEYLQAFLSVLMISFWFLLGDGLGIKASGVIAQIFLLWVYTLESSIDAFCFKKMDNGWDEECVWFL